MPFDKIDIESITEERRKSVAKSIRTASGEELRKLGNEVFHDLDDPWRDEFFKFIDEHSDATIYHAIASVEASYRDSVLDGVHMLYCPDKDKGIWFLPGVGKGILSPTGRQMMKEAVGGPIVKSTVSKETRKDFVLLAITSIAAAIGMRSVFAASRPLARIAIVISDAEVFIIIVCEVCFLIEAIG